MATQLKTVETGIKIEKDVPIPPSRAAGTKYPLREMEVGDSIFVACEPGLRPRHSAAIRNLAGRLAPKKFTLRSFDDGVRCWRFA